MLYELQAVERMQESLYGSITKQYPAVKKIRISKMI
jgi:hypothetical protein